MPPTQLRSFDLNLLVPLKALLHERSVTGAAKHIHLSQSAMSRTLERLRSELGDELLVRVGRTYELTPRGSALLDELGQVLPRLVRLWAGEPFSPEHSEAHIRMAMTDYASSVILPPLAKLCSQSAPGMTLEIVPWNKRTHEEIGMLPMHLIFGPPGISSGSRVENLFQDTFISVLGRGLKLGKNKLSLEEYLTLRHISVETQAEQRSFVDRSLDDAGVKRRVVVSLPYYSAAFRMLETTDLVLTMPFRMGKSVPGPRRLLQVEAPREISPIRYSMSWHPRFDSDPLHTWLRQAVHKSLQGSREEDLLIS